MEDSLGGGGGAGGSFCKRLLHMVVVKTAGLRMTICHMDSQQ